MSETFHFVIKVKYEDTLRRFNSYVKGNHMELDISGLRQKIINLFKWSPDADFTLTYTDEDNDVVSLIDRDDLHDAVVIQHLNPLRINVMLNTNRIGTFERSLIVSSTPIRSPQIRTQLPRISSSVEEALKSIPEPLQSTLLKLSDDLISKAASTPALGDIVEYFSSLGQPHPSPLSKGDGASREPSNVSRHPVDLNVNVGQDSQGDQIIKPSNVSSDTMDLNVDVGQEYSGDQIIKPRVLENATLVDQTTENKLKGHDGGTITRGVGSSSPQAGDSIDLNMDFGTHQHASSFSDPSVLKSKDKAKLQKDSEGLHDGKSIPSASNPMDLKHYPSEASEAHNPSAPPFSGGSDALDGDNNKEHSNSVGPSVSEVVVSSLQSNCPANDQMGGDLADVMLSGGFSHSHPSIQCDGCGMHPIMGPRFKSKVKEDYDLCNLCFSEMGNEADYTKIDSANYGSPQLFKETYNHRPGRAKLESCFIQDVTVLDGTMMAPATPFTKIWRMRNNGTVAWPSGTQLVWIGGDKLCDKFSAELEIPGNDCPVNEELDIAVDFIAPSQPGRYVSYWRMATPSGQKFGQHVWVLIQVDDSQCDSLPGSSHTFLNLNLPPESIGQKGDGIIDMNAELMDSDLVQSDHSKVALKHVKPLVIEGSSKSQELEFQQGGGGVFAGNSVAQPIPKASDLPFPEAPALVSFPFIDFSEPPPRPISDVPASPTVATEENIVERALLRELEEMGFRGVELNKQVLKMNDYNLEASLEDLCSDAELSPILLHLREMGFYDKEMNRELLIRNGGNVQGVIDDLVAGNWV
ncbi:protein JOKA2-like [Tasmannia lanceolata]|uniref:protein JOKA2-like n=1 Tax=Tasmannia lanceolata TaxID=3420 RepID=UPI004063B2D2